MLNGRSVHEGNSVEEHWRGTMQKKQRVNVEHSHQPGFEIVEQKQDADGEIVHMMGVKYGAIMLKVD